MQSMLQTVHLINIQVVRRIRTMRSTCNAIYAYATYIYIFIEYLASKWSRCLEFGYIHVLYKIKTVLRVTYT